MWGFTRRPLGPLEDVAATDREKYTLRGASGRTRIGWAVAALMLTSFSLGVGITDERGLEPEAVRSAVAFFLFALFFWEGALLFRVIERIDGMLRQPGPPAARDLREVCRTRSERAATGFARLRPALPCAVASVVAWGSTFVAIWVAPQSVLADWVLPATPLMIWMLESYHLSPILDRLGTQLRLRAEDAGAVP